MARFHDRLSELDAFISRHKRWPRKDELPSLYQWCSANSKIQELRCRKAALLLAAPQGTHPSEGRPE